jgi:hypothetical protein
MLASGASESPVIMRRMLCVAALGLLAPAVTAGELAGVTLPDQVTVQGKTLLLNGMGLREATLFKVDVYVAGLYLEARSSDAGEILGSETIKRLVMEFVRDVERKTLVKAWTEGFEKSAGGELPALRARLDQLNAAMIDVRQDDVLTFTYVPGQGLLVEVKDQARGTIPGADFARAVLSIWLGSAPPNPGIKEGLLGADTTGAAR